jgi:REP element-mobilizing transposase RayT
MGRPLQIEYPDAFYHITARVNERQNIFKSNRDQEGFLGYLETASERYKTIIHAYSLMVNHYHILLQTPAGNLSQIMHHINGAYTNYFRELHLDRKKSDRDLPDLKQFYEMPELEEIIKHAAEVLSEDAALLKTVQIYLCNKFSGQKLKDIGLHFRIGLSGASQASRRVGLQIKDDKKLKKRLTKLC